MYNGITSTLLIYPTKYLNAPFLPCDYLVDKPFFFFFFFVSSFSMLIDCLLL